VRTMEQQMASSPLGLLPLRLGATIAGAQGVIALLLAALGIFGLVSFAVTRRTREIGIRMALGARPADVFRLVTRQSFKLTLIGLACGLLLALGLTRVLARLLYGVSPVDTVVFVGVGLLVSAITLLACWLPARRATRINPVEALRAE
jgi:putative ABC transport system permease protein